MVEASSATAASPANALPSPRPLCSKIANPAPAATCGCRPRRAAREPRHRASSDLMLVSDHRRQTQPAVRVTAIPDQLKGRDVRRWRCTPARSGDGARTRALRGHFLRDGGGMALAVSLGRMRLAVAILAPAQGV